MSCIIMNMNPSTDFTISTFTRGNLESCLKYVVKLVFQVFNDSGYIRV